MGINRERDWTLEFKRGAMQLGQGAVMGFATGMVVGGCIGSLYVIISGPAPGKTIMATVATQMFQTGGFLAGVMGFGSLLRLYGDSKVKTPLAYRHLPVNIKALNSKWTFKH
ncbi:hypothetical protein BC833DRAFT_619560 [Globomyces pollinis-pini]|nr:hypothetical protein BC833DRAFT_619560 [Globomyces pollinis-pini]